MVVYLGGLLGVVYDKNEIFSIRIIKKMVRY